MSGFEIIDNTDKAKDEFGYCYGCQTYDISLKDIRAVLTGKVLAATINDDEYSLFIKLGDEEK